MRSTLVAPLLLAAFAHTASAQTVPIGPDARYVKLLAGKSLVDGKGFAGLIELGTPTPQMYKALGPGREDPNFVFWYFYDRGAWQLTVIAETCLRQITRHWPARWRPWEKRSTVRQEIP